MQGYEQLVFLGLVGGLSGRGIYENCQEMESFESVSYSTYLSPSEWSFFRRDAVDSELLVSVHFIKHFATFKPDFSFLCLNVLNS